MHDTADRAAVLGVLLAANKERGVPFAREDRALAETAAKQIALLYAAESSWCRARPCGAPPCLRPALLPWGRCAGHARPLTLAARGARRAAPVLIGHAASFTPY